jgi:hypothetical protein
VLAAYTTQLILHAVSYWTQVTRAGHQYRPLDLSSASALTVPSTCMRHSHVPEVTPPPPHQQLHRRHHHQLDSRHSMIPQRRNKTLSCRFDRYERTRPTRNTTFLPSFLKMTTLSPLLRRKRRVLTGGGPRDDLRDIAVARSRGFWSQQRCRFAPLFSAIFIFLGKFVVHPPAN